MFMRNGIANLPFIRNDTSKLMNNVPNFPNQPQYS